MAAVGGRVLCSWRLNFRMKCSSCFWKMTGKDIKYDCFYSGIRLVDTFDISVYEHVRVHGYLCLKKSRNVSLIIVTWA